MYCRSSHPLDTLIHAEYRLSCRQPVARIAAPRERSFIVVEQPPRSPSGPRGAAYLLVKRGATSLEAAAALAKALGAGSYTVPGLKDKEATTAQIICIHGAKKTPKLVKPGPSVWARLLSPETRCPRQGQTGGNCFTIILEPLPGHTPRELADTAKSLAGKTLPNYYGYQRFGTRRPNSHTTGLLLLRAEPGPLAYELTVSHYPDENLDPGCRRNPRCLATTHSYEAKIAEEALQGKHPAPPRWLTKLLLNALQAAIFNAYLTLRIEKGHHPAHRIPGERPGPAAPVPGIGYRIPTQGEAKKILEEALSIYNLEPRDLEHPPPGIKPQPPHWRPTALRPEHLTVTETNDRTIIRFCLPRGSYATILLREIIDPYNL